jgi:NADH:ubiquinone oxidoreductase subunit D
MVSTWGRSTIDAGVLRILLELTASGGESDSRPVSAPGNRKICEDKTYCRRLRWRTGGLPESAGKQPQYCLAVEKLLGWAIPKRAQYIA